MQSIIRFLKNVWNAQRNARELADWWSPSALWRVDMSILKRENAALRQQASKRDSSGRFAPKNTGQ